MLPFELIKDTPYLALSGELWSVFYEYFNRNWSCYRGFLLYYELSITEESQGTGKAEFRIGLWWTITPTILQVLIFAEKKQDVDAIHEYLLLKGVEAVAIHGGKGKLGDKQKTAYCFIVDSLFVDWGMSSDGHWCNLIQIWPSCCFYIPSGASLAALGT